MKKKLVTFVAAAFAVVVFVGMFSSCSGMRSRSMRPPSPVLPKKRIPDTPLRKYPRKRSYPPPSSSYWRRWSYYRYKDHRHRREELFCRLSGHGVRYGRKTDRHIGGLCGRRSCRRRGHGEEHRRQEGVRMDPYGLRRYHSEYTHAGNEREIQYRESLGRL